MANDNKCECGASAPWLVVVSIVHAQTQQVGEGIAHYLGAGEYTTMTLDLSGPFDRIHWASCDEHLAESVRKALDRMPAPEGDINRSRQVLLRGPYDA